MLFVKHGRLIILLFKNGKRPPVRVILRIKKGCAPTTSGREGREKDQTISISKQSGSVSAQLGLVASIRTVMRLCISAGGSIIPEG